MLCAHGATAQLFAITGDGTLYEAFPSGGAPRLVGKGDYLFVDAIPIRGLEYDRYEDKLVVVSGNYYSEHFVYDTSYTTGIAGTAWFSVWEHGLSMDDLVMVGEGTFMCGIVNINGHYSRVAGISRTSQGIQYGSDPMQSGFPRGMCVRDDGSYMWASTSELWMMSNIGTISLVAPLSGLNGTTINGMCAPPDSTFGYASTGAGHLLQIDLYTGVATNLGILPEGTVDVAFVPSPGTSCAMLAFAVRAARRSRRLV